MIRQVRKKLFSFSLPFIARKAKFQNIFSAGIMLTFEILEVADLTWFVNTPERTHTDTQTQTVEG